MSAPAVNTLRGTQMGSANFEFKSKYWRILDVCILVAAAIHGIVAVAVPPIEIRGYQLKDKEIVAIDIPDEIVIPPPPQEVQRPQLPTEMEISDDASVDETIPETDFNPFAPPDIPTGDGEQAESFFAFDTPPKPIKTAAPEYPELARAAGAEGNVLVEVTIDETGRVIAARVVKSDTIAALDEAARKAAMDWLFTPAKQRDQPVKARIAIPFEFTLGG